MIGLQNVVLSITRVLSGSVLRSTYSTLFLLTSLTSISSACPFCGPVETPLSYSIARSSDLAIGESLTEAIANRQGQRRQSFSLLSRIRLTSSGKQTLSIEPPVPPVEAAVETSLSGNALLFNIPAVGWTERTADEMLIRYVLQAPLYKQKIFKEKKTDSFPSLPLLAFAGHAALSLSYAFAVNNEVLNYYTVNRLWCTPRCSNYLLAWYIAVAF